MSFHLLWKFSNSKHFLVIQKSYQTKPKASQTFIKPYQPLPNPTKPYQTLPNPTKPLPNPTNL